MSSSFSVVSSLITVRIVCHRYHLHRWQICRRCRWNQWQIATSAIDTGGKSAAGIVDTGCKFATGINNKRETGGYTGGKFATGVVDTCGNFAAGVVDNCGKFATSVIDTGGASLLCEYLRKFLKKFETVLMEYSGAGRKLIHEKKTRSNKYCDTVPLSF